MTIGSISLKPEEAAAALRSLDNYGAMTPKEATVIHRWQRALRAKAALAEREE